MLSALCSLSSFVFIMRYSLRERHMISFAQRQIMSPRIIFLGCGCFSKACGNLLTITRNLIPTIDYLKTKWILCPNMCIIYVGNEETTSHRFLSWAFSKHIMFEIKRWVALHTSACNFKHVLRLLRRHYKGNNWHWKLAKYTIMTTM